MNNKVFMVIESILVLLGIIFFLAGPAFHFIHSQTGIFLGVICIITAVVIGGLRKKLMK